MGDDVGVPFWWHYWDLVTIEVTLNQHSNPATYHPIWFAFSWTTIYFFQQDNEPKHTSRRCQSYLTLRENQTRPPQSCILTHHRETFIYFKMMEIFFSGQSLHHSLHNMWIFKLKFMKMESTEWATMGNISFIKIGFIHHCWLLLIYTIFSVHFWLLRLPWVILWRGVQWMSISPLPELCNLQRSYQCLWMHLSTTIWRYIRVEAHGWVCNTAVASSESEC